MSQNITLNMETCPNLSVLFSLFCSAGATLLCLKEYVQSDPWLQAESDASWELHGEDSGHLAGWEWILDWAHVLLRPGPK